jgi:hypothetical protein
MGLASPAFAFPPCGAAARATAAQGASRASIWRPIGAVDLMQGSRRKPTATRTTGSTTERSLQQRSCRASPPVATVSTVGTDEIGVVTR